MTNSKKIKELLFDLNKLHDENIKFGLNNTLRCLRAMGNPHKKLPFVIHVAGTNGKGSTIAFLQAILENAGYIVHKYTSPEILKFNERFYVSGKMVSDEKLIEALKFVKNANAGKPLTLFEATTCAGFKLFADNVADFLLLETGMGGRLDATNVLDKIVISCITTISIDHQEFLGNSIKKIAYEKACIQKKGSVSIVGKQKIESLEIIEKIAKEKNVSNLMIYNKDWNFYIDENTKELVIDYKVKEHFKKPALKGNHQYSNAANAIMCVFSLIDMGFKIDKKNINNGLINAIHKGRFEKLNEGPLVNYLEKHSLYLDGGHNSDAGNIINSLIDEIDKKPIYVVCGMLEKKDVLSFLTKFIDKIDKVFLITLKESCFATASPYKSCKMFKTLNESKIFSNKINDSFSLENAVKKLKKLPDGNVIFTGSFHLVAECLSASFEKTSI